jgi:hypothetical protein
MATLTMTTCDLFKAGLGPQIDIAAPTVDVSSIANGAYLRGTVTLSGSASDDVGLASVNVIVTINSTQVASIAGTISSGTWQAAIDTKALSGGVEVQADLDIRATDNSGKVSDKKIVVYFDNVVPAITGMSPSTANLASSDFALSEKTTITGSVKDGLGLAKTNLTVGDISLSDASHPASWSAVLDTSQFYDAGGNALHGAAKLSSGLYQVGYSLISTDYAGNTSEPLTGLLYVNPDGSPVVNVSALTAGVNTGITYPRASSAIQPTTTMPGIATPGSTFKFRVTDLDGIDLSQLYVALALGSAESANPTAAPSALPVPATIYKVGDNSLKQAILDSASLSGGGTVPTRAEYSFTLPSTVGEYMLLIHAADYAANKVTATSAGRYLPSAPSGGAYQYSSLYVTNQTTSVTVDVPAEGTYYSALNASGAAASDDKLKDLSFTITDKATSTELSKETVAIPGAPTAYSWAYSKAGLADGHYSLAVQASSQAGVPSGTVTHNFFIDTSKPTATINPLTGSQSGIIGISGTSSDSGSGIAKVEYQLDSMSGAWTPAGGTGSWSGSLNLSSETEGPHTLYARATDVAGNVTDSGSYASAGFDVDRNLPQATETLHTAVLIQSATAVSFAGKADDFALTAGREATSVELSFSKDGGAAAKITRTASGTASGFTWNSATGDWSWTLPAPSDHSGDGFYTITLTATDRAGKTASVTRTAQIDTTAPTLDVSTPASGMSTSSTTCLISGTSFDTGGAGFDGANDVQYNLNGTGWKSAALSGSYSVSETLSGTEGPQTLIVRSTDKLGNQSADITRSFFYDIAPPVMVESTVGGASNPATKSSSTRSSFYFSGTTFDSDALSGSGDLQVAIDYAAPVDVESLSSGAYTNSITAVDSMNKTWRLNVAVGSGGLADGVHNFVFTAKDIAGKTASVTRTVTVDTTGPVSVISSPTTGLGPGDSAYWLSGTTTSFAGSADDLGAGATGVASVYYTVVAKGAGMPAFSTSTWSSAGGNTSWNAIYPFGSAQGEFTLYVAAVDAVGNPETAPAPRNFGVDQAPPTASEAHAASFATKSLFALSGLITDGNALASLSVTEKKGAADPVTVSLSSPATVGGASQSWVTISLPLGADATSMTNHDNDGSYTYDIVVKDAAGKTTSLSRTVSIDTTAPVVTLTTPASTGLWVSGSAYTIGGEATDSVVGGSGVTSVRYRVRTDATWGSWTTATWSSTSGSANTSGNWSATITGLSEGSHDLEVEATDAAANTTASPTTGSFGVDLSPPTLTSDTPASPIIAAGASGFTGFSGTIGDTNNMAAAHSFTVSYTKNGGTAVSPDIAYTYAAHSTANAWSWTPFPSGINASSHAQDGIYVFTFTATDIAGKPTTVVRNLTIDTMAPQITMTAPTNPIAWYKDSPLKVTGVADDGAGSGVKNVYVRWDIAANGHSGDDLSSDKTGWTKANNTVSWNADLALSTEGALKLWIKAEDNYGNWTTPTEATAIAVNFGYDKTAPDFTSTDTTPSVTNSAFTLGGVLEDTGSGLKSLSITVNGVTSSGASYSGGLWSYPVSTLPADGSYTYVLAATDNANNVSTITRTIYVDTTAPVASFNNIDPAKNTAAAAVTLVDASPKITGSIVDDTGVGTVTSTIRFSTNAGATWSDVEISASLATTGANAKSRSFSKDLSAAPFLSDGLYQIVITAGDTLAAPNSASTTAVWFRLDRNNPTLPALSSSAASANVNADFILSSTASSPNLSSVQWKLDSGAFGNLVAGEEASGTTSYAISLTGAGSSLAEGAHTITVQATSTGLRTTSQSYSFLVDRTAPTPTVSQPTAGSYLSGSTAVVSGGASDSGGSPSGVKSVEYQLAKGLSASSSGSTITAAANHGLAAGDLVRFAAYPSGSLPSALDAATTYYVRSGPGTTTFEVSTTSGGSAVAVGAGSGFFVSKVGTWKAASFGGNAWSDLAVDTTGLSEGNYLLLVRATDNAGNVSAPLASRICVDQGVPSLAFTGMPASGVLSAAFTLSGTAIDPADSSLPGSANGVASVILSLDSGFAHSASVPQDLAAGTSWSFDLAAASSDFFYGLSPTSYAGVPEGAHTIYVRATDKAGRKTELSYAFTKDSVKPAVAYSNLATNGSTVYQDNSSVIMGTFTDSSGVASMYGTIEKFDYSAPPAIAWTAVVGISNTSLGATGNAKSVAFQINIGSTGHDLANGRYRLLLVASDIASAANTLTTTAIEFKVASIDPTLTITSPGLGSFQNGTVTVTGTSSDANEVSSIVLKASSDGTNFATATTITPAAPSWSGGVATYSWTAAVSVGSPVVDGAVTIYVQATAGSGRTKILTRDFTLDTAKPVISITSPSSASRSVGNLTIAGTTTDPGSVPSGVTGSIQYQIGLTALLGNPASWLNANVTGGAYSWAISLGIMSSYANATYATKCSSTGGAPSGGDNFWKLPIYFQATDNAGNVQQKADYYLILDPDGNIPVVTITQPSSSGQTYGGQQRISGMASQPIWIHDVEVAIDPAGGSSFPDAVGAAISGSTINAPGHALAVGRSVFFSATALPQVSGVNVSASLPYFVVGVSGDDIQVASTPGGTALSFSSAGSGVTIGVWGPATLLSSGASVMWYYDINQGSYLPQGGASSQTVSVQARAWNSPAAGGSTKGTLAGSLSTPLTMKFDSTFPKIQGLKVSPSANYSDAKAGSYYNQIAVGGQIYVLGYVQSSKGITKIEKVETSNGSGSTSLYDTSAGSYGSTSTVTPPSAVAAASLPVGGSYQVIVTSLGDTTWSACTVGGVTPTVGTVVKLSSPASGSGMGIPSDSSGSFNYYVAIPVDTASYYSTSSGVYSFDIRATDMTTPAQVSSQSIALNADNYYPTGTFLSSTSVVGTQYQIQGAATDIGSGSGTISGFKKVVVYVTRGANVLNMLDGSASATTTIPAKESGSGPVVNCTYPASSADGVMASIDDLLENNSLPSASGTDHNNDKFLEYLGLNGTSYNWDVQIDSTKVSDGPANIHYLVVDSVGNASHYQVSVYFRNNAPSITSVTLGTDLNGDGTIGDIASESTAYAPAAFATTGFWSKNNKLSFSIATTGGNGQLYYSVKYPTSSGIDLVTLKSAGSFTSGRLYRIAVQGSSPAFTSAGASSNAVDTVFVATGSGSGTGSAYELSSSGGSTSITMGRYYYISVAGSNAMAHGASSNAVGTFFTASSTATLTGGSAIQVDTMPSSSGTLTVYTFPGAASLTDSSAANDRTFAIRVYDSTPGTTPGTDSLDTSAVIALAIENTDTTAPNVAINQLYWNSPSDNSIYQGSADNGHIDLGTLTGATGNLNDPDPRASGKIRYEGTIFDDQRIQYVRMRIYSASGGFDFAGGTDYGAWHTVAAWNPVTKALVGIDDFSAHGWKFTVSGESIGSGGHSASWKLEWDTANIKDGADTNVIVAIEAQDFLNPGANAATTANYADATRRLDIVPYILDLTKKSVFTSRLTNNAMNPGRGGYYGYYQNDAGIVVSGFNLPSITAQTPTVSEILVGATQLDITTAALTRDSLTVTIPGTLTTSGPIANTYITVRTNSISSINNVNDVAQGYNSTNSANGDSTADNRNRRQMYIDDQAPAISVAPFGKAYPSVVGVDASFSLSVASSTINSLVTSCDLSKVSIGQSVAFIDGTTRVISAITGSGPYTISWSTPLASAPATSTAPDTSAIILGATKTLQAVADYTENIDYLGADASVRANWLGHVEYAEDNIYGTNDPALSGWVCFKGKASDNQRIKSIKATIPNFNGGAEFTIYTLGGSGTMSGTGWRCEVEGTDNTIDDTRIDKGHVLNWKFYWNSSLISDFAVLGRTITFKAYDSNSVSQTSSPYIKSILRNNTIYNTNRSKYGKYPIPQGEAGIVVSGFNLLTSTTQNTNNWVRIYNAATGGTQDSNAITVNAAPDRLSFTMTLSTAQHSGWLRMAVAGIEAANNMTSSARAWDREDDGNGISLTKWNDDRYLSVWNINQWANSNAFSGSSSGQYPTFALNSSGTLYGSWINYANATVSYSTITGTSGAAGGLVDVFKLYDPPEFTDISIDQSNNNPTITYVQNTFGGSTPWNSTNSGSLNVWCSDIDTSGNVATGFGAKTLSTTYNELAQAFNQNNSWVYYGFITDGLWHNTMLWEHYSPRVVRSGGNIHVVWYDASSKSIKYSYFSSAQHTNGGTANTEQKWINIDGGSDGYDTSAGTGLVATYSGSLVRATSVGGSVSVDVDKSGYPVIAYYDNANHVLRIAHANSATPTALTNWKIQAVDGGGYDSYAGADSSDKNGNITIKINHQNGQAYLVAYRPSKGQLVYGTAADRNAQALGTNTDYSFGTLALLDGNGNVGSWSDMSLTGLTSQPYIVYQNKSMLGTYDGVKVAYYDSTQSDWDTLIPPSYNFVGDGKLSIASNVVQTTYASAYGSVPWTMAVGFKSSSFYVMYLQPMN